MPSSFHGKQLAEREGRRGREQPAYPMEQYTGGINWDFDGRGRHSKGLSFNPEELPINPSPGLYARDGSRDDNVEWLNERNKFNSTIPEEINSLSIQTASRRSRSFSPGGNETWNKKPALVCEFFAQGWCVRGDSCKFLHQKDAGNSCYGYKEITGTSNNPVYLDHPASLRESKESFSTMFERPVSPHAERVDQQRSLVKKYGRDDYRKPQISDNHDYSLIMTSNFSYSDRSPSTLASGYWQNDVPEYGRSELMGFSMEPAFSAWQSSLPFDNNREPCVLIQSSCPETATAIQYDQSVELPNAGTTPTSPENLIRERDSLIQKDDKDQVIYLPDGRNLKKDDLSNSSDTEETRALKIFRASLIDFIKELIRPFWKECRITKDEHKSILKKIVEKVLSTLGESQIPRNMESVNQYLSSSSSKLLKLVEGYVFKYEKSRYLPAR